MNSIKSYNEEMYYEDDYYSEGFENYDRSSIDPGPYMMIGVSLYSLLCVLVLPLAVSIWRWRKEKKSTYINFYDIKEGGSRHEDESEKVEQETFCDSPLRIDFISRDSDKSIGKESVAGSAASIITSISRKHKRPRRRDGRNAKTVAIDFTKIIDSLNYALGGKQVGNDDIEVGSAITYKDMVELDKDGEEINSEDEISNKDEESGGKNDHDKTRKKKHIRGNFPRRLLSIARIDDETKAIMKLGGPLTLSSVTYDIFDAISTALISRYLGVDALAAYIVTNLLIGLSECLIDGVGSALSTVCSHAIGMNNYRLAGQYVQIAGFFYFIFAIPTMGVWWFKMGDCIRLFQMNDNVVEIGAKYTKLVIFHYILEGAFDGYTVLLDINGQVLPATIFDILMSFADMAATWILVTREGADLLQVGISQLVVSIVSMVLFSMTSYYMGWLDPFLPGLVKSLALKNTNAVKTLVTTSIPLSLGYILSYGEWEALTFIAAFLGPAEVAAWGLLESLWGVLESVTHGAGEGGCIRLALHLGKGNIELAKQSAWKSLFLCSCLAIFISAVIFLSRNLLIDWYTQDETLQTMMLESIPLVALGNILMVFGMVCWSLVGAQGRYRLATTINAIVSFTVTLPLSALFCIHYRYSLKALVASVVAGYSTAGLFFAFVLLTSNWEHHSANIRAANEDMSESSDEDEESSSSDSSSTGSKSESSSIDPEPAAIDDDDVTGTSSVSNPLCSPKIFIFDLSGRSKSPPKDRVVNENENKVSDKESDPKSEPESESESESVAEVEFKSISSPSVRSR